MTIHTQNLDSGRHVSLVRGVIILPLMSSFLVGGTCNSCQPPLPVHPRVCGMCASGFAQIVTWSILPDEEQGCVIETDRTHRRQQSLSMARPSVVSFLTSHDVKLQDAHRNCVEFAAVSQKGEEGESRGEIDRG
jgi:hypothetical protein